MQYSPTSATEVVVLQTKKGIHVASEVALKSIMGKVRFSGTSIKQTLKMTGGKAFAYGFGVYNWTQTLHSAFYSKAPSKRARERGYTLK